MTMVFSRKAARNSRRYRIRTWRQSSPPLPHPLGSRSVIPQPYGFAPRGATLSMVLATANQKLWVGDNAAGEPINGPFKKSFLS